MCSSECVVPGQVVISASSFALIHSVVSDSQRLEPSGNYLVRAISHADAPNFFAREELSIPTELESTLLGFIPAAVQYVF